MFKPKFLYDSKTDSNSFFLNNPLSTNTHVKFSPIALCIRTPATVESTPPDNPRITLSSPIVFCNFLTVFSTNNFGVQVCEQPQISTVKFFSIFSPKSE